MPAPKTTARHLRHRVQIQEDQGRDVSPDAEGQTAEDWQTVAEVWAAVESLKGQEYWSAQQAQSEATVLVTMRLNPVSLRLTGAGRIVFQDPDQGERVLHPAEPPRDRDGDRLWLVCYCKEIARVT